MKLQISQLVDVKNRYHEGYQVSPSADTILVHDLDGKLILALHNGADVGKVLGARDEYTRENLPRVACLHKESKAGELIKDEEFEQRLKERSKVLDDRGVALSVPELKELGFEFDKNRNIISEPEAAPVKKAKK